MEEQHVGGENNLGDLGSIVEQGQSLNVSHDDQKINFENIKSRLRPRNPVNYNQVIVHSSPSTPIRERPNTPGKIVEYKEVGAKSAKRKINEESKRGIWSIFLLSKNLLCINYCF